MPKRMLDDPIPDVQAQGHVVNRDPIVSEYYEIRGCDRNSGFPARETVSGLSLEDSADDLKKMGKPAKQER